MALPAAAIARLPVDPRIAASYAVAVFNDRASLEVTARVSGDVRPGVVCLPSGYWASRSRGGLSVNALTSDTLTDRGGGAALHSTLVEVEPLSAV